MTTAEQTQFDAIVAQVSSWPPERRAALVRRLAGHGATLRERVAALPPPPRGFTGKQLSEIVDYQGPSISDAEVRRILEDALLEKYG